LTDLDTDELTTKNKLKLSKLTYMILLSGVIVVAGTVSFTLASPLTELIVNPASTIGFKGTQYALSFTTPTAGTIKSIEVLYPAGTTISVGDFADIDVVDPTTGVAITGTNLGTTTFTGDSGATPTMIYTFDTAITTPANADWFVLIIKVRNPDVSSNISASVSVTTKDSVGVIIDGPSTGAFAIQQLYNADSILNAINSKAGDICIGSGCP
jgi:hypothetical protein